ncbi:MAG: DUF1566 domain-containing protein [Leptospiraceae bacterium]|nr:DUF1566 domain-containing protein [Leptospiraceae bacterium]
MKIIIFFLIWIIIIFSTNNCYLNPVLQSIFPGSESSDDSSKSLLLAFSSGGQNIITYTISGTVSGLSGSGLVIQNNGGDDLSISSNGTFSFPTTLPEGDLYSVSVLTSPSSPTQVCTVNNGSGTISTSNITDISIVCSTSSFSINVNVSGLIGSGLVLQNNSGDDLSISSDGTYTFSTKVASSADYLITTLTQPVTPTQICSITNGSGTVTSSDISDVSVICSTSYYKISGSVTGLNGSGLVLQNNSSDNLSISSNGNFEFSTPVASSASYSVSVFSDPSNLSQTCTASNNSGTVTSSDITNVSITCVTNSYSISVSVSGLSGSGLILQNNGGNNLSISSNTTYSFSTSINSGSDYNVTVSSNPSSPTQTCSVTNSSGTVTSANITNVSVTCSTNTYTLSGTISGLSGSGLVIQNNSGDDTPISNGATSFSFPTKVASGAGYNVTVKTNPSSLTQVCSVTNGSGTISSSNITNISITCSTSTFTISATVSGYAGSGLKLRNNGGDDKSISGNGTFTFTTPVASGGTYNVTVYTEPSSPTQTCSVNKGSGTVTSSNISDITVSCTTNSYSIGGSITGLSGTLVIQNNSGNDLSLPSGTTSFTFTSKILSGSTYSVTVLSNPTSPYQDCTITNGSGTVTSSDISNVSISCVNTYTVRGTITELFGGNFEIQNNGGDKLTLSSGTSSFTFATRLSTGSSYSVSILTQPTTPTQTCKVTNGSGTISSSNITNVSIICGPVNLVYSSSANIYTVGQTITNTPTYQGTITSCSSSPSLPSGLSISNSNCEITGTPDTFQVATSYTITASNSGGSITGSISIGVAYQTYVYNWGTFYDQMNGTIYFTGSDSYTEYAGKSVIFMKCSQGQVWNSSQNDCTGTGSSADNYGATNTFQFCDASNNSCDTGTLNGTGNSSVYDSCNSIGTFAGRTGWRAPTIDELETLINCVDTSSFPNIGANCPSYTSPTINTTLFPNTVSGGTYWTSSSRSGIYAYWVLFRTGRPDFNHKTDQFYLRCATSGP